MNVPRETNSQPVNVSRETIRKRVLAELTRIKVSYLLEIHKQIRELRTGKQVNCTHCGERIIYHQNGFTFIHWYSNTRCSTGDTSAWPDVPRETIETGRYDMY